MHLIWENLVKNLVLHWTGVFKGLGEGTGSYCIDKSVWDAIGAAAAASGATIPGSFGARPPNFATEKMSSTADTLDRKFTEKKYYDHFVQLVCFLHMCLQFEITRTKVAEIRQGFIDWVAKYEEFYYQHDPNRVSACPLTIHVLLHIADMILISGPLVDKYTLFPPTPTTRPDSSLVKKVMKALETRYNLSKKPQVLGALVARAEITQYSSVRVDDGDLIYACLDVDRDATRGTSGCYLHSDRNEANTVYDRETCFGRLHHLFCVKVPTDPAAGLIKPKTVLFAGVTPCKGTNKHDVLNIHVYKEESVTEELVDLDCVMHLVGRMQYLKRYWVIIDRSGSLARAVYEPDD
ncbi:hypothetical protein PENSPDRAFT_746553 [Peniophora sp. CONT]|nr:hypothetical protein PENSPDRAFT_746553 [Peniophora sp. CONT]